MPNATSREPAERPKPSRRPRFRYILFQLEPPAPSRSRFIELVRQAAGPDPPVWLTRYDGRHGIVRVPRGEAKKWVGGLPSLMQKVGVTLRTLSTSGSIAGLRRNRPEVHLPAQPR